MNAKEVFWRIKQKCIQREEKKKYALQSNLISANIFNSSLSGLHFDENTTGINYNNLQYSLNTNIELLGNYDYQEYKNKWHCGFQTPNEWPLVFSYKLDYKQCDSIGDARTNWELNRHFQFTLLAKNYYVSGNKILLAELQELLEDWIVKNPFLYGISWTSMMEIAIRSISWMFTLAFLKKGKSVPENLVTKLEIGILNMVSYVYKHYSRYSSANNHLIVEALAIGLAGYSFKNNVWKKLAIQILTDEIPKQNYTDGVNKELSLHYQLFVMEAYALMTHIMQCANDVPPKPWIALLEKMSEYTVHSSWKETALCEFGDDDEGKIIDLSDGKVQYFNYILQLSSLVTNKRYHTFKEIHENIKWLFLPEEIAKIKQLHCYTSTGSRCFAEGGNSFLRDKENRILIGIDHAALGFGSIAAHGHADALSFQILVDGEVLFADPGTYIYHCNLSARNYYRQTINHNTLCINKRNQSEMLGAFLWGNKAHCHLRAFNLTSDKDIIIAKHNGYSPNIHTRTFDWDKLNCILNITDSIKNEAKWCATFILGTTCHAEKFENGYHIYCDNRHLCRMDILSSIKYSSIDKGKLSSAYGKEEDAQIIRLYGKTTELKIKMKIYYN